MNLSTKALKMLNANRVCPHRIDEGLRCARILKWPATSLHLHKQRLIEVLNESIYLQREKLIEFCHVMFAPRTMNGSRRDDGRKTLFNEISRQSFNLSLCGFTAATFASHSLSSLSWLGHSSQLQCTVKAIKIIYKHNNCERSPQSINLMMLEWNHTYRSWTSNARDCGDDVDERHYINKKKMYERM